MRQQLTNAAFVYPEYAKRKFHAYDGGNLEWRAVWEIEPVTASLAVRIFKADKLQPQAATAAFRQSFIDGVMVSIPV